MSVRKQHSNPPRIVLLRALHLLWQEGVMETKTQEVQIKALREQINYLETVIASLLASMRKKRMLKDVQIPRRKAG